MIGPLFIAAKIAFEKIREEKDPENGKHDEELHKDDPPQLLPPGHSPEAFIIEPENLSEHITKDHNQFNK